MRVPWLEIVRAFSSPFSSFNNLLFFLSPAQGAKLFLASSLPAFTMFRDCARKRLSAVNRKLPFSDAVSSLFPSSASTPFRSIPLIHEMVEDSSRSDQGLSFFAV